MSFLKKLDVTRIQFWMHDFVIFYHMLRDKPITVSFLDTQEQISIDIISYDWTDGEPLFSMKVVGEESEQVLTMDGNMTVDEIVRGAA